MVSAAFIYFTGLFAAMILSLCICVMDAYSDKIPIPKKYWFLNIGEYMLYVFISSVLSWIGLIIIIMSIIFDENY